MSQLAEFQSAVMASLHDSSMPCPEQVIEQCADRQSRRFNIYRNNRMVSIIDNLQAAYPAVCKLVGDEFFRACARVYIKKVPPLSPVMSEYGAEFSAFLEQFPNAKKVPYIADVARLEWARLRSYHAQNATALGAGALASIAPESYESLCFTLHPSLHLVTSRWPVGSIAAATVEGADEPAVNMNSPESVVVVRPGIDVTMQILPADGALLLSRLQEGEPLLTAVDFVSQRYPAFDPGTHLQGLFALGAFIATYRYGK